jgi:outer membrane protein, heavy metal efflux system
MVRMTRYAAIAAGFFFLAGLARPAESQRELQGQAGQSALDMEGAVREALGHNPSIQAARNAAQAAAERIRPAGALADPQIEISASDLGMDGGAQKSELMLRQMIDWPGKRSLMRQDMRAMAGMSAQDTAELELEVAAQVREAFWDLHLVRKNRELAEKTLKILGDFAQIAETRYAVGSGIQQDVLRAQSEVYKLQARLLEFQQEEAVRLASLDTLLGRAPEEPLEVVIPEHSWPAAPGDAAGLIEESLQARPMLRGMALEVQRQEVRTSLAKKDLWPNLELRAGIMRVAASEVPAGMDPATDQPVMAAMPADTAFSVGVMASVPLWKGSKQDRQIAAARAEHEAAQARLEAARLAVGLQVQTLVKEANRIREQMRLYDDEVLPRARQAVDSALESYQAGQADFLTLLSSQIALLDNELEQHRLQALYHKALARLDQAVGRNAPRSELDLRATRTDVSGASGTP